MVECFDILSEYYGKELDYPTTSYKLRGCTGATAVTHYDRFTGSVKHQELKINSVLFTENLDDYLGNTIGHEICHLVVRQVYGQKRFGKRVRPHGQEWKTAMSALGLEPSRTHEYDTTNAKVYTRKRKRHVYECDCMPEIHVTPQRHNKIQRGQVICRCRMCKSAIRSKLQVITL